MRRMLSIAIAAVTLLGSSVVEAKEGRRARERHAVQDEELEEEEEEARPRRRHADREGPRYGSAGCGLGAMIFGNTPGLVQLLAVTTNNTSYSQTFGITSGTSYCSDSSGGRYSALAFVETNQVALLKDMSRGSGESIRSLAAIAGCVNADAVGSMLQSRFGGFSQAQAAALPQQVVDSLRSDDSLRCWNLT